MDRQEILKQLQKTDPERVKAYLEVLDRFFLQTIVHRLLDENEIQELIKHWQEQIKAEINFESGARNEFLMGTPIGRIISTASEEVEDGESIRLTSMNAMKLAQSIAHYNFGQGPYDAEPD